METAPSLSEARRLPRLDQPRDMPLREQVAEHLRHAFIIGDIAPGQILSAPTLAANTSTSSTPSPRTWAPSPACG